MSASRTWASGFYEGVVAHRRLTPCVHAFRYRVCMTYLDLGELSALLGGRYTWSTRWPAIAWFRRADYLGPADRPLEECVRELVQQRCGRRPQGPIRLLTNLRYWGVGMNPLSLYYCFDEAGEVLEAVVAEVTNTPWGEQHHYVLDFADPLAAARGWEHPKELHVSPFFDNNMTYRWRLSTPGEDLRVEIENSQRGDPVFRASLQLQRRELTPARRLSFLVRYPALTAQVLLKIYWQAFRLWIKGVPYVPHPHSESPMTSTS